MMKTRSAAVAVTLLAAAGSAAAQSTERTTTIVAGPDYKAGGLKRAILGDNWRALWLAPIQVPVLDLGSFAGGLTPEEQGGGNQSVTLHFLDASGEGWVFRSIDKYPEQGLPPELDGSFMGGLIADQISALNPGASRMMPPILEAAGILHVEPALYVMPDDPRLGEYRRTFAGMLGGLEFKPNEGPDDTPGWASSRKIKGTDEFLNDMEESPEFRLEAAEFLRARLIDMWVGDPDRGSDQWRWARYGDEGNYVYRPIPRDRDWAFVNADGFLAARFRGIYPKILKFGADYPAIEALTFSSHYLDRRLLSELTRADFEAAGRSLQQALTDEVIDEAVANMPRPYDQLARDALTAKLRSRREQLPALAIEFFEWLATDVDVRATDARDFATVEQRADGTVRLRIAPLRDSDATASMAAPQPWFERIFLPDETSEIRVFLHGDEDHALVTGPGDGPIKVRIIGGGGDDVLEDRTGSARFYDHRGDNDFITASGTSVDEKPWDQPEAPEGFRFGRAWAPDYGGERALFSPAVDYGEGAGVIIGGGPSLTRYGFRRLPYRLRANFDVLYATRSSGFGAELNADYRLENSALALLLDVRGTQFDAFRFYGLGNETPELDRDATLVMQDRVRVHPALSWHLGERPGRTEREEQDAEEGAEAEEEPSAEQAAEEDEDESTVQRAFEMYRAGGIQGRFTIGPVLQWTKSHVPAGNPLGEGAVSFGQVGGEATLELRRTDRDAAPRRGFGLYAEALGFPATWDADGAFGRAAAEVNGYFPLIGATHLAMRLGGEHAFGDYPIFEAAFIGGRHSLRGFRSDRYAGDAAAFGGIELRVPIDTVEFIVNGELGVFGLADAARVWADGDSPGGWHTAFGGGLWFAAFDRAFSVAYARGARGRLYLWQGLPF